MKVLSTIYKNTKQAIVAFVCVILLSVLPVIAYAQTLTFSSTTPSVPVASILQASTVPIYCAKVVHAGAWTNLNAVVFTPSGTFVPADISTYSLRYGTSATFSTGTTTSISTATALVSGNPVTFGGGYINAFGPNTYYFWITADISDVAVVGHTLAVAALTTGSFTYAGGSKLGSMSAGGTQTILPKRQFKSTTSGNWATNSTWLQSNDGGSNWVAATTTPTNTDGAVTIQSGHTVTVAANVSVDEVTVNSGGTVAVSSGVTLTVADGTPTNDMIVNGTLQNNSGTITSTGILAIGDGGVYQHAMNGGAIPTASWNVSSTCLITGITSTVPTGGLNQVFGNFTWNCAAQSANIQLNAALSTVNGNFTISSTNASELRLSNGTAYTLTVGDNFSLTAGTLNFNAGGGVVTMNVGGNFTHTGGTITETAAGSGLIVFNGTTQQIYTSGGTVSQAINFTVNSGATLQMGTGSTPSYITGSGTFTLLAGASLGVTDSYGITTGTLASAISGNIRTTGGRTFTAGANYIYNGTSAQVTGNGFTTNAPANLTINNTAGVTLSGVRSISGVLTMTAGTLTTTTTNLLTLTNAATTAVVGGSAASYVNGPLNWTLPTNLASGSTYNFPVGVGQVSPNFAYYPFSLVNPTTGATTPTVQVEAKAANAGGSIGTGISARSTTEYWVLTTTGSYTSSGVSVARPTLISPYNVVATSASLTGAYSNLGGAFDDYGVLASNSTSNKYFCLGTGTTPALNVDKTVLYGFNYPLAYGPSAEQSFKVSGIALTADVTVTPLANFEISTVSGGIFQSTAITLTRDASNTVDATIYVRLKSSQALGNYNSTITVASTGLSSKIVTCYGSVSPTITASGGGSYCVGSTISLTSTGGSNRYWTGPNSFYSLLQNPTVTTSATTAMAGAYIVTGSTPSGTNLVTNGDFSSGDTGFTSTYTKSSGGSNGLWTPGTNGIYAVIASPQSQHSNFCVCGDHTNGSGLQLVANGAGTVQTIWSQTINSVTPYTNYQFTYWIQTVDLNDANLATTQLFVNTVAAGASFKAIVTQGAWTQFLYNWYSGSATSANLELKNIQTNGDGNDFALDDIRFEQVYTSTASVNVSVLDASTPANLVVSASANPVNAGTSVTYTATPTNGGTAPTYQWYVNGTAVSGATGATYTNIPTNSDVVSCTMTSNSACYSGGPVSSSVTMIVYPAVKNYWLGGTSTNWGTASNWTAGYVPGTGDNVEFATTTNYGTAAKRDLVLDADRTVGLLINATAAPIRTLYIPAARSLTVNDTISIPAVNTDSSRIYIQASADGTQQNGTLIFYNKGKVYGSVEMYARGSYSSTGATYGGNTYHYSWQYFGVPVASLVANPTLAGSYVRSWYEPGIDMTTHWKSFTNDSTARAFYGYELTQQAQKVIVFKGQLVNSDWTSPVLAKTATAAFPGQYVFANPYTAALSMSKFITTNLPYDTDGAVYLYSTGSYASWGNAGIGAVDGTSSGQYQVCTQAAGASQISSMQAVLMQVVTGSTALSKVAFKYSDVVKNAILQRTKGSVEVYASLLSNIKIEVRGENYKDNVWLFSDSTFTSGYDKSWDGYKLFGVALAPQLYAVESDGLYQINCKKNINNTVLGFKRGIDSQYTLTFTNSNTERNYGAIYLIDSVGNKVIDVTQSGTQYTFNADSVGNYSNRFRIITRNIDSNSSAVNSKLTLLNAGEKIFVENLTLEKGEFSLYDMAGRKVSATKFNGESLTEVGLVNKSGIYIGRASTNSEKVSKRFIITKE